MAENAFTWLLVLGGGAVGAGLVYYWWKNLSSQEQNSALNSGLNFMVEILNCTVSQLEDGRYKYIP